MNSQSDATMARNGELMPLSGNERRNLLSKLQGSVHFEKILTASSVYSDNHKGPSTMALPSWFVDKHGDKFRKSVILRSASTTTSWTVNLSVYLRTPTKTQVKFAGGWKPFATFNGLLEGDALIFSLTAVSEFEVYLFRGNAGELERFPSQAPRKRSDDSELARKKPKQSSEWRDEQSAAADGNIEGLVKSNSFIAEYKTVGDSAEHSVSASGFSTSCRLPSYSNDLHLLEPENGRDSSSGGHRDSHDGHKSSIDHVKLDMMSNFDRKDATAQQTDARTKKDNVHQALALEQKTEFSHLPGFFRKLTVSNFFRPVAAEGGQRTACLEIPPEFRKKYGVQLRTLVKLQGIREESPIRTVACSQVPQGNQYWRLYLRAGWRDFADENSLEVGQWLLFSLVGDSFFAVRRVKDEEAERSGANGRLLPRHWHT